MTQRLDIKRLNDGSIDYAHYIARSQAIRRSDVSHALATIYRALKAAWNATKLHMAFRLGSNQSQATRHLHAHAAQRPPFSRTSHL